MTSFFGKIKTKIKKNSKKLLFRVVAVFGLVILIASAAILSYFLAYTEKIYPNTFAAGIDISGLSQSGAKEKLSGTVSSPTQILLKYQDKTFDINTSEINFAYNLGATVDEAYKSSRSGNFFSDLQKRIFLLFQRETIPLEYSLNEDFLASKVNEISQQVSVRPVEPSVNLNGDEIIVNIGKSGSILDETELTKLIYNEFSSYSFEGIDIPIQVIDPTLNSDEKAKYEERTGKFLNKKLVIKFEYSTFSYEDSELVQLLDPKEGYNEANIEKLVEKIDASVEREPQNSKFSFSNGKVTEFQPALDGIKVDKDKFKNKIIDSLNKLSASEDSSISLDVPVARTSPDITTAQVNDFGIKELVGRGTSTYYHSIASRVHNVALAASKINGTLVKPGDTFSFNQTLGEVSASTGYQQAYVISEGRTILGDGGGVCQVSTTLFRAVLDAGLPVVERQAHAYRVSYYEQDSPPGIDATVYSPSPDFKFTNDTGNYILIEAIPDTKNYALTFELYGTSDGRVSTISKPVVTNVTAPPEDLYQDDPTLPTGTIKQIDWKAWGAKVTFNYKVTKDGKTVINKTFISNYKPWQAVYLRGTGSTQ